MMKKICCLLLICLSLSPIFAKTVATTVDESAPIAADSSITATQEENSLVIRVVDWYNHNLNYVSVTMLMALESSFIPFPSEVVVPPAAYQACNPDNTTLFTTDFPLLNVLLVVLVATLGALIGAFINYYLAFFLGRPIVYWFADSKVGHLLLLDSEKVKKAEDYFIAHGNSSTFIGRLVPGIRQLISIPAGLAKMKIAPFIFYTILGSGTWNIILAILGYIAHGQQDIINKYSHELSYVLLALGVLFILFLIYKGLKSKKNTQPKDDESKTEA